MTPSRWQQVKSVLGDALEHSDHTERKLFLARICAADTALRREVESLLAQTTNRLETCAEDAVATHAERRPAAVASSGHRLGAYELIRELGRGGMGAVWLARRADGRFDQQVAVKLLKRGTDTEEVLRRFRDERRILARLEHPNIARLLDGGETDDGLPYFVMEYVADAARLTDFARGRALSIPARLALFRKICAAVQFAHQNLVVHRDLKPGNILVTPEGEPKLLDFGIAKLLETHGGETTPEITVAAHQRLTPAYASPEQVRGAAVTTVSDVYALGALLYELLSGQPPHRFASARPSPQELARVIIREEPPRPSQAAETADIRWLLRGDLDNIVRRAMAKDPARRYPSASALGEDLRRHLENRPVRARPDTLGYRTAKFVSRNKLAVAATALFLLLLLSGGAATVWQARRAERRFQDVRRLAKAFLFDFHDAVATLPGATPARQLVVSRGLEYLDDLAREAAGDRALQLELAAAYLKVGDVQGKPYTPNLGDSDGALRSYEKAAGIALPLAAAETGSTGFTAHRLASQACASLAEVQTRLGRSEAAAENHRRALALAREALARDRDHADEWRQIMATSQIGLGDAIQAGNHQTRDLGRYRAAVDRYRAALPLCEALAAGRAAHSPEAVRVAKLCARLAGILAEIGSKTGEEAAFTESLGFYARGVSLIEAALQAQPGDARLQRSLADILVARAYARVLAGTGLKLAQTDCQGALAIMEPLAVADPLNAEAQQDLSYAHYNHGRVLQAQGEFAAAAAQYQQVLQILEPLVAAQPENVEIAFDLARARRSLGEVAAAAAVPSESR